MRRLLLFASSMALFAAVACNGEKVQTPTSDSNFDDDGDQGMMNDPGTPMKDGGAHDAAPLRDASNDSADASDAAIDAPEEPALDASVEAADDAPTSD